MNNQRKGGGKFKELKELKELDSKDRKGKGGKHKEMLVPTDADDILTGSNRAEVIKGGLGNDKLNGGNGKDILHGEAGNDELTGGNGNDVLIGMNAVPTTATAADLTTTPLTPAAPLPEVDILIGGRGKDTFVLGQAGMAFYTAAGEADYAVIKDFKKADRIQLTGAPASYTLGAIATGTGIYMSKVDPTTGTASSELIAVLEGANVASVNLATRNFVFV